MDKNFNLFEANSKIDGLKRENASLKDTIDHLVELEKENASLKDIMEHCPSCKSRKYVKSAVDAMKTTDKLADQLNKELKAKCEELEANLKTHKEVINGLHELLLQA